MRSQAASAQDDQGALCLRLYTARVASAMLSGRTTAAPAPHFTLCRVQMGAPRDSVGPGACMTEHASQPHTLTLSKNLSTGR